MSEDAHTLPQTFESVREEFITGFKHASGLEYTVSAELAWKQHSEDMTPGGRRIVESFGYSQGFAEGYIWRRCPATAKNWN